MTKLDSILDEFERTLEVERELGRRAVQLDRALLLPVADGGVRISTEGEARAAKRSLEWCAPAIPGGADGGVRGAPTLPGGADGGGRGAPALPSGEATGQSAQAGRARTPCAPQTPPPAPSTISPIFAFVSLLPLSAEGDALLKKMIAAMKCADGEIAYGALSNGFDYANAQIVIMLGSQVMRKLMPQGGADRGVWKSLNGKPAIATISPDFILQYHGRDEAKMRADKTLVWKDLRSALARAGRKVQ